MKIAILLILSFISGYTYAGPLDETRCCITPARTESGEILRRADVLRAFQKIHPCPSTGLKTGACPGWQRDHVLPLACGGFDIVSNLQWLPVSIKTAAGTYAKDRFERKIYCEPMELVK